MGAWWSGRLPGRRPTRIYLHIGAMKTGTTYLQTLMAANRAELAAAGILFPGEKWSAQSRAVREILFSSEDPRVRARTRGKWQALCAEAMAHRGKAAVVSMEFLSFADSERAAAIVDSLEGLEVHVVLTVRDAQTAIPAQWQTSCRNGSRVTYRKFVRGARYVLNGRHAPRGRASHLFDRTQGIPRMLDVWVPLVGAERVHVITVPPRGSDPTILWRRFAQVIRVKPGVVSTTEVAANPSLGHASSELLRRINSELGKVPPVDYWKIVKGQLARSILGDRVAEERPVQLHRRGLGLARRWNRVVRRSIREHGVHVVGSLDELPVGPPGEGAPEKLPEPTSEELLAAATTALTGLQTLRASLARGTERLRAGEVGGADDPAAPVRIESGTEGQDATDPLPSVDWLTAEDPVAAAVGTLTELVRECIALHQQLTAFEPTDGPAPTRAAERPVVSS